jgi:hypothetical protein
MAQRVPSVRFYPLQFPERARDLADEEVPKQMLELATHIIATKAGPFSRRNSKITTSARSAN